MIVSRIYTHARQSPARTALVWNGLPVSYLHLARAIERARAEWRALGLPAGSVAVVIVHSLLESWPCVLALQSLGLRTVCAPSLEAAHLLDLRDISCFVLCANKAPLNQPLLNEWRHLQQLAIPANLYEPPEPGWQPAPGTPIVTGGGHILSSSGTTGRPKKLFHDAALDEARCSRRVQAEQFDTRTVSHTVALALWTAGGYRRPLVSWYAGGCAVFDQRETWALHLGDHGTTHLMLVPGLIDEALAALRRAGTTAPARGSFELTVGGGALSPSLAQGVREHLTPDLTVNFGSTELWLSALRSRVRTPDDLQWLVPWEDREVQIVAEDDTPCADGVDGLLRVRLTPLDYPAYLDDPETSARMFRDGWFYPGDLAVRRADGRIRILGRTADVINVDGSKVASGPIEEAVRDALGASAVCAFSGPDATGEHRVVLAVEIARPASEQQLQHALAVLNLKSARFTQMPRFPRTGTGMLKIDRIALRRRVMPSQPKT